MADFTPEEITAALRDFFAIAGKRTYVGLRYVPIFGRKGEDTMEWDGGLAPYEPLTIVLHEGNSYTSRTYVPAGVEITNTEYWAETGDYNAQVESYRREVVALGESVSALGEDVSAIENILPMSAFTGTTVAECIENDNISRNRLRLNVNAQTGDDSNPNMFKTIGGALAYACKRNRSYLDIYLYTSDTYECPYRIQNLDINFGTPSTLTISPTVNLSTSVERCFLAFTPYAGSEINVNLSGCSIRDCDVIFRTGVTAINESTNCYIYSSTVEFNTCVISIIKNIFCYQSIINFNNANISFTTTSSFSIAYGSTSVFENNNTFTFPADKSSAPFLVTESNLYYKDHFYVTDEYTTTIINLLYLYNSLAILQKTSADEMSAIFTNGYITGNTSIVKRTASITELT